MTIDTDLNLFGCTTSTFSQTFIPLAKGALFLGLFIGAMKALETYFGIEFNGQYQEHDTSDDDEMPVERRYTQIQLEEEVSSQNGIVSFATEQVLEAIKVEKEEEQVSEFVIGAEDIVDHFNRMTG